VPLRQRARQGNNAGHDTNADDLQGERSGVNPFTMEMLYRLSYIDTTYDPHRSTATQLR
jgi:hypothetical protein